MIAATLHLDIEPGADQPVRPRFVLLSGKLCDRERSALMEWAKKAFGSPSIPAQFTQCDALITEAQGDRIIASLERLETSLQRLSINGGR